MELNIPESSYDVIRKICKDLRCGVITETEARNLFAQEAQKNGLLQFQPMSDDTITPDNHPGHFPGEVVVGFDIWEDDGGLLSGNFKFGDSITFNEHHGLKAQIQVIEQLPCKREDYTEFVGIGTIEGYTASKPKEIRIEVVNSQIHALVFTQDSDDLTVFNSFPLWQEALEHQRKAIELQENIISELIQRFMDEGDRTLENGGKL